MYGSARRYSVSGREPEGICRFWNNEGLGNPEGVIDTTRRTIVTARRIRREGR